MMWGRFLKGDNMFDFTDLVKIPTYKEWKNAIEKIIEEQPAQAKKFQEQIQQFWSDAAEDIFKIKK
tara:strand:+ start:580 stop:777 length:198 start_codon:yes stop_codon:yes gene_type:complete